MEERKRQQTPRTQPLHTGDGTQRYRCLLATQPLQQRFVIHKFYCNSTVPVDSTGIPYDWKKVAIQQRLACLPYIRYTLVLR
jgi:hypothetical protein